MFRLVLWATGYGGLADNCQQVCTSLLTASTGLSTHAAMLTHFGVFFTLGSTVCAHQWDCSCMSPCPSRPAAHAAQGIRRASNAALTVARLLPGRGLRRWPVAVQISAQSRLRRMQLRSSVTISSPRQASAHAVQV